MEPRTPTTTWCATATRYRPACRLAAALRDARDLYAWRAAAPAALPVPAVFLRAERGMLDQPEPMYAPGEASRGLPGIDERTSPAPTTTRSRSARRAPPRSPRPCEVAG